MEGPLLKTHGDAELRHAVGEVGGAVERIDIPAELPLHAFAGSLFAVDAVVGPGLGDARADELLNGPIGDGDQVDVALVLRLHAGGQKFAQARSGLARDLRGAGNPDKLRGSRRVGCSQFPRLQR